MMIRDLFVSDVTRDIPPVVYHGPYEYSSPVCPDKDFLMQTEYIPLAQRVVHYDHH